MQGMSNQQWQGNGEGSPWAHQDPNWRPTNFKDPAGRDPMQPFGQQPQQPQHEDLEPPRRPIWPWILGVLGVVAALLIVLVVQPSTPEPQPTDLPPASRFPSPSTTGNALPYEGNGTGTFEITAERWDADGVDIDYRITTDDGSRRFAFFVFINDSRESYVPDGDPTIQVSDTMPAEGTIHVQMPRGAATLVLTTTTGRAITALPLKG